MSRLPTPGQDSGQWGGILNDFLAQAHNSDGSLKPSAVTGAVASDLSAKADTSSLASVATSGDYADLSNAPTIPSVVDATATDKGIVMLAGDLGGTAAAPTVPDLATKAAASDLDNEVLARQSADAQLSRVEIGGTYVGTLQIDSAAPSASDVGAVPIQSAAGTRSGKSLSFAPVMSSSVQQARTDSTAYATPFHLSRTASFDAIGCHVLTGGSSGAVIRLGIYADDGSGAYPGTLTLDAGTVDATTTGEKRITISQTLAPGTYWLVAAPQGAPSGDPELRCIASGFPNVGITSGSDGTAFGAMASCYSMTASGAFASTWTTTAGNDIWPPRVFLGAS